MAHEVISLYKHGFTGSADSQLTDIHAPRLVNGVNDVVRQNRRRKVKAMDALRVKTIGDRQPHKCVNDFPVNAGQTCIIIYFCRDQTRICHGCGLDVGNFVFPRDSTRRLSPSILTAAFVTL